MKALLTVLHWIFGGIFVFAGITKVADPQSFLASIRGFRLLPDPFAASAALGLPWLEIFCGAAVMAGVFRRAGLLLLNVCLVSFIIALLVAKIRGLDVTCGCFGSTFKTSVRVELAIDFVLLAVGAGLLRHAVRSSRDAA